MSRATSSVRTDAPPAVLTSPTITHYNDHVTIRVPNGQWNEALQDFAQYLSSDPRAVAEMMASEPSQPSATQRTATAVRPVLQSDPRDDIPLTYCNNTRRIIALVGFVVSSATILGVQLAAIEDRVPGFPPLMVFERSENKTFQDNLTSFNQLALAILSILSITGVAIAGWLAIKFNETS